MVLPFIYISVRQYRKKSAVTADTAKYNLQTQII